MDAVERAIAEIQEAGRRQGALLKADADCTITISVAFHRDNGDDLQVTLTGIAPFTAEPTVGGLTRVPGWTVLGQPNLGWYGQRRTRTKAVRDGRELFGGLPLLRESEARRLADAIASTLQQKAA